MTPAPRLADPPAASLCPVPARALPVGARLRDYEIRGVVGDSTVALVYTAWDHSLQRTVAIKEYIPSTLARRSDGNAALDVGSGPPGDGYRAGLQGFVEEARQLARFDHPSLLKVYRFWQENDTAYRVMPFHDGPTLTTALARLGRVPGEAELRAWLKPVLDAVAALHAGRTWHRHIGPDEIVLTPVGPILLGFAADARALAAANGTPTAVLAPGYAAPEQYGADADTACGPWTDLYSLAAVVYGAIAGAPPDVASDRLTGDALQPLTQVAAGLYQAGFLAAIDAAMALDPAERPQDHVAFRRLMGDIDAAEPVSLAPPRDLMQEPFLGTISSDREITVPDRPLLATATATGTAVPVSTAVASGVRKSPPTTLPARPAAASQQDAAADAPTAARHAPGGDAGKRVLHGVVAATCVGIGIAALGLQFYLRPASRDAAATPTASAPAALAPTTATTTKALPTISITTPASGAPVAAASPSTAAASATVANPPERPARCIDILQKASLEAISAADTEFFKKECK